MRDVLSLVWLLWLGKLKKIIARIFQSCDPGLWVECISALILIGITVWFALRRGRPMHLSFASLMPVPMWVIWTAIVGLTQGISVVIGDWRTRATADSLATMYWLVTSLQLGIAHGFTVLHPMSTVMTLFCGLTVARYFWKAEQINGSQSS